MRWAACGGYHNEWLRLYPYAHEAKSLGQEAEIKQQLKNNQLYCWYKTGRENTGSDENTQQEAEILSQRTKKASEKWEFQVNG